MMINKYALILLASILNFIILFVFKLPIIKAGFISVGLLTLAYIIYMNYRQSRRYRILEEDLDPQAFIEASQKAYRYAGDNLEINNLLNFDYALGHICLGQYKKALEFLKKLNPEDLKRPRALKINYYNLLIIVYGKLGMKAEASRVYEGLRVKNFNDKAYLSSLKLIESNNYLNIGHYKEAREILESYIKEVSSKRLQMEILFDLGYIAEKEDRLDDAKSYYRRVKDGAGKLYIAQLAKNKLDEFK